MSSVSGQSVVSVVSQLLSVGGLRSGGHSGHSMVSANIWKKKHTFFQIFF